LSLLKVVNDQPMSPQDIRTLYKFKRYANRYNLTIMKLIKAESLSSSGAIGLNDT
jgi:hypothetical protein